RVVECTDWFMHRLTGGWTLSLNNVTVKWDYARPDGGWSRPLLSRVGLDDLPEKWPSAVVTLGKGEGKLSAPGARELGLGAVPPGCEGLVCLDHWQGNRCPLKDPRARGAFWGLTLSHGPGHVFRSIYEGTAFGTRHILEDLEAHGFRVNRLFAGGGGARSRLWLQIHADVLGQPIHLPRDSEACALGSALIAA